MSDFLKYYDNIFAGETFSRYTPLKCFAQSEMCETLLVCDESERLYVAKCYKNCEFAFAEDKILSRLSHAGIPKYESSFSKNDEIVVIREYIDGIPLDEYIQTTRPSKEQIIRLLCEICDTLSYLHTQTPPVIHRDVKFSNIIMREDSGAPVLIDFGISKIYNEESSSDTNIALTRESAAPEQYGFAQSDARSDIYSFGVMLRNLHEQDLLPDNRKTKAVIEKCLKLDPKDRYQNIIDVKKALVKTSRKYPVSRIVIVLQSAVIALLACVMIFANIFTNQTNQTELKPAEEIVFADPAIESAEEMVFADPAIESAVRLYLNKSSNDTLYVHELLAVDGLYIMGNNIFNSRDDYINFATENGYNTPSGTVATLEDLRFMPNLRDVYVELQPEFSGDLSPLKNLQYMRQLGLNGNYGITDITPLSELNELFSLGLQGAWIESINPILSIENLEYLGLGYTKINSIDGIDKLQNLRSVRLANIYLHDLTPLKNLPALESVYLSSDYGYTKDMTELVADLGDVGFGVFYE